MKEKQPWSGPWYRRQKLYALPKKISRNFFSCKTVLSDLFDLFSLHLCSNWSTRKLTTPKETKVLAIQSLAQSARITLVSKLQKCVLEALHSIIHQWTMRKHNECWPGRYIAASCGVNFYVCFHHPRHFHSDKVTIESTTRYFIYKIN